MTLIWLRTARMALAKVSPEYYRLRAPALARILSRLFMLKTRRHRDTAIVDLTPAQLAHVTGATGGHVRMHLPGECSNATLGAAAFGGATTGAWAGAEAGPLGALAGAFFGAALGAGAAAFGCAMAIHGER